MTITKMTVAIGCLALAVLLTTTRLHLPLPTDTSSESKHRVVATVGSRSITLDQVEQATALPLYQMEEQRAKLLLQAVQHLIDEELLKEEAADTGVSVTELLDKASQSESVARLANLPGPVRQGGTPGPGHDARLDSPESARIRQALLVSLRRRTDIRINLPESEMPILAASADDDPWTGVFDAPVTIIEFSDFECPYCKLSVPVLQELLAKYTGKVKLVYRDFPGPNHPYAQQAAEAAQCAAEQGQFWPYHDALFARQATGTGWNFSELAKQLGLQRERFATCLDTGRYRTEVAKDLNDGLKLGVTSTPTFFVNGRPLVGAHPSADFQKLIDKLLDPPSASRPLFSGL